MVVVPTSNHVSLHYGETPVDIIGWLLTFLGIALAIVLWRRPPVPIAAEPERPDFQVFWARYATAEDDLDLDGGEGDGWEADGAEGGGAGGGTDGWTKLPEWPTAPPEE
jgi:hypothetical protein